MSTLSLNRIAGRFSSAMSAPKTEVRHEAEKAVHLEVVAPSPSQGIKAVDDTIKSVDNAPVTIQPLEQDDMSKIDDLKAKQAKIKEDLDATEKQIQELEQAERNSAIGKIKELITTWDVQPGEVFNLPAARATSAPKASKTGTGKQAPRGPAPIKFKGPNGEQWTGRGQTPKWLAALIAAGKAKESFAV